MKEVNNKINVRDGRIIYRKAKGYVVGTYINYGILDKDGHVDKILSFNMWDDFSFSGVIYNEKESEEIDKIKELDFIIDKQNPMYNPLKRFLGQDKEFLLDDDNSAEINRKTMQILDEEDDIKIIFKNEKNKKELFDEKFNIFVKNILFDGRSKLNQERENNTKERLINLFRDFDVALIPKELLENIVIPEFDYCINNLDYYKETIFEIIPELKDEDGFDQKNPYHIYDVWEHTVKAVQKSKNDLDIRLALLLHDIGKPHSYQEENGVRHFEGHPQKSAEMAKEILTRLGYDEKKVKDICFLIANHATTINIENVNEDNLEITKKLLHIQYCDAYAYNPEYLQPVLDKLDPIDRKLKTMEKEERGER